MLVNSVRPAVSPDKIREKTPSQQTADTVCTACATAKAMCAIYLLYLYSHICYILPVTARAQRTF